MREDLPTFARVSSVAPPSVNGHHNTLRSVQGGRLSDQIGIIDAGRVDVIDNTKENILTLVTCDATGARRLLMRGKLVKVVAYDKAPAKIQKNLSGKYTNGQ